LFYETGLRIFIIYFNIIIVLKMCELTICNSPKNKNTSSESLIQIGNSLKISSKKQYFTNAFKRIKITTRYNDTMYQIFPDYPRVN